MISDAALADLHREVEDALALAADERERAADACRRARYWRDQAAVAHRLLDEAWPRVPSRLRARITGWVDQVGFAHPTETRLARFRGAAPGLSEHMTE
jgi:hypothetical protein